MIQFRPRLGFWDQLVNDEMAREKLAASRSTRRFQDIKAGNEPERHQSQMLSELFNRNLTKARADDIPRRTAIAQGHLSIAQRQNSPGQLAALLESRLANAEWARTRAANSGRELAVREGNLDLGRKRHDLSERINNPRALKIKELGNLQRGLLYGKTALGKAQTEDYLTNQLGAPPGFPAVNEILAELGFAPPNNSVTGQPIPQGPDQDPQQPSGESFNPANERYTPDLNEYIGQALGGNQNPDAGTNMPVGEEGPQITPQSSPMPKAPVYEGAKGSKEQYAKLFLRQLNTAWAQNRAKTLTAVEDIAKEMDKDVDKAFKYSGPGGKVKKAAQSGWALLPFTSTPEGIKAYDRFKQGREQLSSTIRQSFGESITPQMHEILNNLSYNDAWSTTPDQAHNLWGNIKKNLAIEMYNMRRGLISPNTSYGAPLSEYEESVLGPPPWEEGEDKKKLYTPPDKEGKGPARGKDAAIASAMKKYPSLTKAGAEAAWAAGKL